MTETIHNTLWKLFETIKIQARETGDKIIHSSDNKRLLIGWKCGDDHHYVTLMSLRRRLALLTPRLLSPPEDDVLYKLLNKLIIDTEGRIQLANILNSNSESALKCFQRIIKLRAFW